jgi:hypothetical protein
LLHLHCPSPPLLVHAQPILLLLLITVTDDDAFMMKPLIRWRGSRSNGGVDGCFLGEEGVDGWVGGWKAIQHHRGRGRRGEEEEMSLMVIRRRVWGFRLGSSGGGGWWGCEGGVC